MATTSLASEMLSAFEKVSEKHLQRIKRLQEKWLLQFTSPKGTPYRLNRSVVSPAYQKICCNRQSFEYIFLGVYTDTFTSAFVQNR